MKRSIKSSRVIIINAVLMLVIVASLITLNIYFLDKNNSTQSRLDKSYNRKIDVIMLMTKTVRERSLHMLTMYLSKDVWEQDKIFLEFHKLKLVFLKLNDELKAIGLSDEEKVLYEKINKILNKTELIQINIVERIQSGSDESVHSDMSKKDLPLEYEVLGIFDVLIAEIRQNANIAREEAKQQYRESVNLVLVIAAIIFFIVIILMRRSFYQLEKIESGLIREAESLSWDATHDALTNVYNRRWLQHKFELLQESQQSDSIKHSLLYIDLDEFKPVNDRYGHVAGDEFLCGITRELEKCIRQNDTLARMGGDEFAILLENCDTDKASEIAECIITKVNKFSLAIDDNKVVIAGCSVGVNTFVSTNLEFSQYIKDTDSACYTAKQNGKNQIQIISS